MDHELCMTIYFNNIPVQISSRSNLPRLRTKFGQRAFSHAGPAAWNNNNNNNTSVERHSAVASEAHSQRTYVLTMIAQFLGNNSKLTFLP